MGQLRGVAHTNRVYRGARSKIDWTLARPETIRASIEAMRWRIAHGALDERERDAEESRLSQLINLLRRAQ